MNGVRKLWGADVHYLCDEKEKYAYCPKCNLIFTPESTAVLEDAEGRWVCEECALDKPERYLSGGDFLEAALDGL